MRLAANHDGTLAPRLCQRMQLRIQSVFPSYRYASALGLAKGLVKVHHDECGVLVLDEDHQTLVLFKFGRSD